MKMKEHVVALVALLALMGTLPTPGIAAEQFPSDAQHRGIREVAPYKIFPENRAGNGIYLEDRLLLSLEGLTMLDIMPMETTGRFVYLASNALGESVIGVRLKDGEGPAHVSRIMEGYYHASFVVDGIGYKKLYRHFEGTLQDLLPYSRTASKPTAGALGVVFYHVAGATSEDVTNAAGQAEKKYTFNMRVHFSRVGEERLLSLGFAVQNARPSLELKWLDENQVQVELNAGRKEVYGVSEFQ